MTNFDSREGMSSNDNYNLSIFTFYSVQDIVVSELICRSAKHLFTSYVQGVDMMNLSASICHFLNCLLSSCATPHTPLSPDDVRPFTFNVFFNLNCVVTVHDDDDDDDEFLRICSCPRRITNAVIVGVAR